MCPFRRIRNEDSWTAVAPKIRYIWEKGVSWTNFKNYIFEQNTMILRPIVKITDLSILILRFYFDIKTYFSDKLN